jgi:hypothetical protein
MYCSCWPVENQLIVSHCTRPKVRGNSPRQLIDNWPQSMVLNGLVDCAVFSPGLLTEKSREQGGDGTVHSLA